MRQTILVALLLLSLTACAGLKQQAIDAGKEIAAQAAPIIAEKATEAGAKATANAIQADESLDQSEKDMLLKMLYGSGALSVGAIFAVLKQWAKIRLQKGALGVVVKAVDRLPEEIGDQVKDMVGSLGGSAPAIKKTITAAKS